MDLMPNPQPITAKAPARIEEMFGSIARRYDLNNRIHSLWRDQAWRRAAATAADASGAATVLDVACGTGDLTAMLARQRPARIVGADFCEPMLQRARAKFPHLPIEWQLADAMALPFADGEFDIITIAFGLRNLPQPERALGEFLRVLRPGGRLVVLDFRGGERPGVLGRLLSVYTNHIMPRTAALLAGDRRGAYQYLQRSVRSFWSDLQLVHHMQTAGFVHVSSRLQTMGLAMIATGFKR